MIESSENRIFTITNKSGMHCRPSASFVKVASQFQANISVKKDGEVVDGKSILGLMMLAVDNGTTIDVSAVGPDAKPALDALETLIENNFNDECIK